MDGHRWEHPKEMRAICAGPGRDSKSESESGSRAQEPLRNQKKNAQWKPWLSLEGGKGCGEVRWQGSLGMVCLTVSPLATCPAGNSSILNSSILVAAKGFSASPLPGSPPCPLHPEGLMDIVCSLNLSSFQARRTPPWWLQRAQ